MKKLFALFAFLTCFMGASAIEIVDAEVDFSKYTDISEWNFPNSWGGSESARARLSIVDGCLHFQSDEATDPSWDCQFFPIGFGNNAEPDVTYTLHFKVKGDHDGNVSMLGFGQTPYGQFAITTDWVEGTVDYVATNNDGNVLMQCGDWIGSWDIAYLKITHEGKEERPAEWIELLTNGDAETPWTEEQKATRFDDQENNYKISAWGKEKGVNMNDDGGWDPFPATIEEVDGGHVFVVHGKAADTEGDASAWDNQFWIQAPRQIKAGEQVKVHFRYKASEAATTNTQIHHQNPSDYMHWQAIGDINFTTEWQEYDQTVTWPTGGDDKGWSIAFNLNPQNKNAIDFYFDDLSIAEMKLDHGYFIAASNTKTGTEYDYDNAIEFAEDPSDPSLVVATVGTAGKQDTWVNEVMISTVRGNDKMYKASTIKPIGTVVNDPDTWLDFTEGSNAKIKLPAAGVWTISIAFEDKQINFVKVEGEEEVGPIEINPNPTSVTVNGVERDYTESEQEGGTGFAWDNQFWIMANRTLSAGEETIVEFDYVANKEARTTTQCHVEAGAYLHWGCIGDVNFTTEEQHFSATFTVPAEADGMQSIAFNMAEIKEACDYTIKNVVWKLADNTESLINQTGGENFWLKISAGTTPYQYEETAINGVTVNKKSSTDAIYNLAGQRVSKSYKGIVVKDGKKYITK